MSKENITLIIGLGNPILGDDGVGWVVAENIQENIKKHPEIFKGEFEIKFLSLGGLSLMEQIEGFTEVIIIDSIHTGTNPNGTVISLPLSKLPNLSSGHSTAVHDTSLASALEVGRLMNMVLPDEVWVVAVETDEIFTFSEELSEFAIKGAVEATKIVQNLLTIGPKEQLIIP